MSPQAHSRDEHERAGSQERVGSRTGPDRPWLLGAVLALAFVALAWFGRQAGVVLAPIAFAFFVALAVHSVSSHVQGRVRPGWRWVGPVAAMALVLAVLVAFGAGVWMAGAQVAG